MTSNTAQNDVYTRRINTVISHVRQNLDGDLSLDTLSRVGRFSKFIFTGFSNRSPKKLSTIWWYACGLSARQIYFERFRNFPSLPPPFKPGLVPPRFSRAHSESTLARHRLRGASSTSITEMRAGEAKLYGVQLKTSQRNK